MTEYRTYIGSKLRELREFKGLSLRQLAELTGFAHQNIYKIEQGRYSVGIDVLTKICEALDAKVEIVAKTKEQNIK